MISPQRTFGPSLSDAMYELLELAYSSAVYESTLVCQLLFVFTLLNELESSCRGEYINSVVTYVCTVIRDLFGTLFLKVESFFCAVCFVKTI